MSGEEIVLKINITGSGGSGKTRLIITAGATAQDKDIRVDNLTPWSEEFVSTVGGQFFNFGPFKAKTENQFYQFAVWDLGGQIRYSDVRKVYLEGTDAILAVVDISRKYSLQILRSAMLRTEVKEVCGNRVPILICGNKADLRDLILTHVDEIAQVIYTCLQEIIEEKMIKYQINIKIGPEKGVKKFQSQIRQLNDRPALRVADFEVVVYKALLEYVEKSENQESFTNMNLKLLARELWFVLTDALFEEIRGDKLPYSLLERASLGSPLFREYTKDPDVLVPIDWSLKHLKNLIKSLIIQKNDLKKFIEELKSEGYRIVNLYETSVLTNHQEVWSVFSNLFKEALNSKSQTNTPNEPDAFTLANFEDF
ncbi:MAG: GTP-binding protein [Candidatus Hodarchaeota archaeon]